jgi:hypothetical protein
MEAGARDDIPGSYIFWPAAAAFRPCPLIRPRSLCYIRKVLVGPGTPYLGHDSGVA